MEEIIEQLARREIRDLLADTEDTIKEAVKTLFFSELRLRFGILFLMCYKIYQKSLTR